MHTGPEVHERFSIVQYGNALQMTTLADIVLQLCRQPPGIDDGIIRSFAGVNDITLLFLGHMQAARAMAA